MIFVCFGGLATNSHCDLGGLEDPGALAAQEMGALASTSGNAQRRSGVNKCERERGINKCALASTSFCETVSQTKTATPRRVTQIWVSRCGNLGG